MNFGELEENTEEKTVPRCFRTVFMKKGGGAAHI